MVLFLLAPYASPAGFVIYDAMQQRGKPDLEQYGFRPLNVVYARRLWPQGAKIDNPDTGWLGKYSKVLEKGAGTVCLDIEHWSTRGRDAAGVESSINKLLTVITTLRKYCPDKKYGYYGTLPVRDYWAPVRGRKDDILKWQHQNSHLDVLAAAVDYIFPSLYTFYNDKAGWTKYAIANIREARKYGKPVIVFLWPQYHDSNFFRKFDYIDGDYWRLELETAWRYADGLVIWTPGGKLRRDWDESQPWWQQTKQFIKAHGLDN